MRSRLFRFLAISILMALTLSLFGVASAHAATPATSTTTNRDYVQFTYVNNSVTRTVREGRLVLSTSGGKMVAPSYFRDVDGVVRKISVTTTTSSNDTVNIFFKVGTVTFTVPNCDFLSGTECLATTTSGTWTSSGVLAKFITGGSWASSASNPTKHSVSAFSATFTSGDGIINGLKDFSISNGGTCNSQLVVDPFGTLVVDVDGPGARGASYLCLPTGAKGTITRHDIAGKLTSSSFVGALREDKKRHFALAGTGDGTNYTGTIIHPFPVTDPDLGTFTMTIS